MSWPLDGEQDLELGDIQGHVLVGFGGAPQALGAYTARDPAAAARTVGRWAGRVTTAGALYATRKGRRARDVVEGSGPWVAIAVSHRVLRAAGRPADFDDDWFERSSMAAVTRLNDPWPADGAPLGSDWVVGGPSRPVDVLVVVAAGKPVTAEELVSWFTADARVWMDGEPFVEHLLPMKGAKEHFGFRDGISQPAILGTVDGELFDDDRPPDDGRTLTTSKAQDLVWPGEFVFGYSGSDPDGNPRVPGPKARPHDDAAAAFARNGSMLVYRRLVQDVAVFRRFCAEKAAHHADDVPGLTADTLAELLVGRRPDGLPLTAQQGADVKDPIAMNGFSFHHDAMDEACPRSAHIRKVNPRAGDKDQRLRRILRRGAPFGEPYTEGEPAPPPGARGLAFLAYQTNSKDQFGMLATDWANNSSSPAGGGGHDLLIGQVPADGERWFDLHRNPPPAKLRAGIETWVRMTGGAFLFTPSLSALRSLVDEVREVHT